MVLEVIWKLILSIYIASAIALFVFLLVLCCEALGEFKKRHPELSEWKYKRFHTDIILLLLFCMIPLLNTLLFISLGGSAKTVVEVLVEQIESEHGMNSSV